MAASERLAVLLFLITLTILYGLELLLLSSLLLSKAKRRPRINLSRKKWARPVHILAVLGVLCMAYGRFIEPYWVQVAKFKIAAAELKSTNLRLVHISDMHCETKVGNEDKLVKIINGLEADVIVFTGDATNNKSGIPLFNRTMKSLEARLGKFAVRGNWDHFGPALFEGTGFELLNNKTVTVEKNSEALYITGLNCGSLRMHRQLLKEVPSDAFSIILHHNSDFIEDLDGLNVDLYLCGHTHGGQVRLPFYGALVTLSRFGKKYEAGMYEFEDTILYVNRGIGVEGRPAPKVRFGTRPEITVFDIVPVRKKSTGG